MVRQRKQKPEVFTYFDYREFLRDWFAYLKKDQGLKASAIAAQAQLSGAYLSMVIAGKRDLTLESALKLLPCLKLERTEQSYLENLIRLSALAPGASRADAVRKLHRYSNFRKRHGSEAVFFQYVSNWYYVAIRELATLPGFSEDPDWVRSRLKEKPPIKEVQAALAFLEKNGFLKRGPDGQLQAGQETLHARGLLYWTALTQFHSDMFGIAARAIENTDAKERNIQGYTLSMSAKRFEKVQKVLNQALDEIEKICEERDDTLDSIYQVEMALFPLTYKGGGS